MVGSLALGIVLFIVGAVAAVALPGAGPVVGVILIVLAVLIVVGGFASGRRRAAAPRP